MFSSVSSRKPLLRSNSDRPAMRNWPLFLFLFGLVFFFYLFYIYQAQSTELSFLREQLDSLQQLNKNTKQQLIDSKADLEKFRSIENTMKNDRMECTSKVDECTTSLRNAKLKVDNDLLEKNKLEQTIKDKEDLVVELRRSVAEGERNTTSLKTLLSTQEIIAKRLTETIEILKNEVTALKSGSFKTNAKSETFQNSVNAPALNIAAEIETTTLPDVILNASNVEKPSDTENEGAVPQLDLPIGPGDRVKLEDRDDSLKDSDRLHDNDYDDKKNIPVPEGPLENGGEQL